MSAPPVLLDTNILLLPWTQGTDVGEELIRLGHIGDWIITTGIQQELMTLGRGGGATARAAKAARQYMLPKCSVETSDLPGDDGILDVATRLGAVVCSNDGAVQKGARRRGLQVVGGRGRHSLHDLRQGIQ